MCKCVCILRIFRTRSLCTWIIYKGGADKLLPLPVRCAFCCCCLSFFLLYLFLFILFFWPALFFAWFSRMPCICCFHAWSTSDASIYFHVLCCAALLPLLNRRLARPSAQLEATRPQPQPLPLPLVFFFCVACALFSARLSVALVRAALTVSLAHKATLYSQSCSCS